MKFDLLYLNNVDAMAISILDLHSVPGLEGKIGIFINNDFTEDLPTVDPYMIGTRKENFLEFIKNAEELIKLMNKQKGYK